ncbi:MAG: hypothetical protein ACXQTI_04140 [Candidatus Nezhaarchaeales archaeon]
MIISTTLPVVAATRYTPPYRFGYLYPYKYATGAAEIRYFDYDINIVNGVLKGKGMWICYGGVASAVLKVDGYMGDYATISSSDVLVSSTASSNYQVVINNGYVTYDELKAFFESLDETTKILGGISGHVRLLNDLMALKEKTLEIIRHYEDVKLANITIKASATSGTIRVKVEAQFRVDGCLETQAGSAPPYGAAYSHTALKLYIALRNRDTDDEYRHTLWQS